jgi:anti-sigma regulatory factor (Ser/Thr protein kinase)
MILNLSLNLPTDAAYIGIVRVISTTLMAYLGVAADKVADAAVVIGEICSNVVRHAHTTPEAC